MIAWLYSAILKPRLLSAAEVWWPWLLFKMVKTKMSRFQTLIFRGITGAMSTTLTGEVGYIVCEEPIHIATIAEAAQTMGRLTAIGKWTRVPKRRAGRVLDCTKAQKKEVCRFPWDSTLLFCRREFSPSSTARKR